MINIRTIPSIYAFYGPNLSVQYREELNFKSIDNWIIRKSSNPIFNISTEENIDDYISDSFVTFLASNENIYREFSSAVYFRNTSNVFLFRNNSLARSDITAFLNRKKFSIDLKENENISDFIWRNQFPVPLHLNSENFNAAQRHREYFSILIVNSLIDDIEMISFASEHFYQKIAICWMEFSGNSMFFKRFGVSSTPSVLVIKDNLYWKKEYSSLDNVNDFYEQIINKTLAPIEISDIHMAAYDFISILYRYPLMIIILLMLVFAILIVIYLLNIQLKRLKSHDAFRRKLKRI